MAELNVYRCTPRQLRGYIIECLRAGLVPFVRSSPGVGKSSINRSIANDLRLFMRDHRLSTSVQEDMTGLPQFKDGRAFFSPFRDLFPLEGDEVPEGFEGWMLFLDEFNSASKDVQAAAYKLILDRMVGQHRLHERCVIAAAGNLDTDKAIVNRLSTAMQSRLVHLELEVSFEEWMQDVALPNNYDPTIIAFLSYDNKKLMDFDPNHQNSTFNCPRTWEFMDRLAKVSPIHKDRLPLYAGTISSGSAVELVQFAAVQSTMVQTRDILRDPAGCVIPSDNAAKWMVICHMMSHVTEDTFGDLCIYANRFDMSMRVLFYRSVMSRHEELRRHPAFARAMIELDRYLNDPVLPVRRAA